MAQQGKIYGEWEVSTSPIQVEIADYVLGARIVPEAPGQPMTIDLQWRTSDGTRQVRMDRGNALMVLSLLKCIQLDQAWPFPLDPRDPNWRAGDGKP